MKDKTIKRFLAALSGLRMMLRRELHLSFKVPLSKRIAMLTRGFCSESAGLYDFEKYSRSDYLSEFQMYCRAVRINAEYSHLMNNKIVFTHLLKGFATVPDIYAIIEKGKLYGVHDSVEIESPEDLVALAKEQPLIIKPNMGGNRRSIQKLFWKGENLCLGKEIGIGEFKTYLESLDDFHVCQWIQQAAYSREIFPHSANTVKLLTMIDPYNGKPFLAGAFHRFGRNKDLPIDNVSDGGGIVAIIDVDTGVMTKASSIKSLNPEYFASHPITGRAIEGVTVPNWDNIKREILKLAECFRYIQYIAWDAIIQDNGFTTIEGNANSDIDGFQSQWPLLIDSRVFEFYRYHHVVK